MTRDHRDNPIPSSLFAWNRITALQQQERRLILYSIEHCSVTMIIAKQKELISDDNDNYISVQVLKYIVEGGWIENNHKILIVQSKPEMVVISAQRIMKELESSHSNEHTAEVDQSSTFPMTVAVGYTMPFQKYTRISSQSHTSSTPYTTHNRTQPPPTGGMIHYVTYTTLLQEIAIDPLLSQYSIILIDHIQLERTMDSDITLGLLQKIRYKRTDPIRIIMIAHTTCHVSAVLEFMIGPTNAQRVVRDVTITPSTSLEGRNLGGTAAFTTNTTPPTIWNQTATVLSICNDRFLQQPQYPIQIVYLSEPTSNYSMTMIETIYQIHIQYPVAMRVPSTITTAATTTTHTTTTTTATATNRKNMILHGDILCLLPSLSDVDRIIRDSEEYFDQQPTKSSQKYDISFIPLYPNHTSSTPTSAIQQQQRNRRMVYYTTNTLIESWTIPNIQYVIDTGFIQLSYLDTNSGLDRSCMVPIHQDCAQLRTSCCVFQSGIMSHHDSTSSNYHKNHDTSNICFRLYTESYYLQMSPLTPPEIVRTNPTHVILQLKSFGIDNIFTFDLIDVPSMEAIQYGLETLYALGAIDDTTSLTPLGYDMVAFPVEPRISRMLLASIDKPYQCSTDILTIASILYVQQQQVSLFLPKPRINQQLIFDYEEAMSNIIDPSGDHVSYCNIFSDLDGNYDYSNRKDFCQERFIHFNTMKRCMEIRHYLTRLLQQFGPIRTYPTHDALQRSQIIRQCITTGFFMNVAKLEPDGRYYTLRHHVMVVPSKNSLFTKYTKVSSEYIMFHRSMDNVVGSRNNDSIEIVCISAMEAKWLREIAPHYYE
jgi:ATP-dependent RNA helicase DDX35